MGGVVLINLKKTMTTDTASLPSKVLGIDQCEHEINTTGENVGWPICDAQFAGWAPTVSSRFTFSMAGQRPDKSKFTANLPTPGEKRHIAHLEHRETKDAIWLSRVRKQSKYVCYMAAETCAAKQLRPNLVDKLGLAPCPDIIIHEISQHDQDEKITAAIVAAAEKVVSSKSKSFTSGLKNKIEKAVRISLADESDFNTSNHNNSAIELQTVPESHGKLSGVACMFFPSETAGTDSLKLLSKTLEEKIEKLNASPILSGAYKILEDPDHFMRDATEDLTKKIDVEHGHSLFLCRFELHRSGELRIFIQKEGLPREMLFPITMAQKNQLSAEEKQRYKVEEAQNSKGQFEVTVTPEDLVSETAPKFLKYKLQRQAEVIFDFIRDTFHNHYHHGAEDDRMVNAFRTCPSDDYTWRLGTLQRLMTTVQVGRRSKSEPSLINSMGILSYVEAFQNQVAGVVRAANKFEGFTENLRLKPHNLKHLESSLQIEIRRREKESQTKLQILLMFVTVLLSATALIIAAILRAPYDVTVRSFINKLAEKSVVDLGAVAIMSTFLALITAFVVYEIALDKVYTFKLTRKTTIHANRLLSALFVTITKRKLVSNWFGRLVTFATAGLVFALLAAIAVFALKYALIFITP